MTIQTELLLVETSEGLGVIEARSKQTMFSKATIHPEAENLLRQAIANEDDALLAATVAFLTQAALEEGWDSAPGAYHLKHNGYMVGVGLPTRSGMRSDITLTVRTDAPLV